MPRIIAITSSDSNYFPLLRDMVTSFRSFPQSSAIELGCFDLGLSDADKAWLAQHHAQITEPKLHFDLRDGEVDRRALGFLVRPYLPSYFPGYDLYLWIDSDIWLQSWDAIEAYLAGATTHGMAIAHERERAYRFQSWLFLWTAKHFLLGYGPFRGGRLLTKPHLNAGLFAGARDAPHWAAWAERYRRAFRRTGKLTPHDQFALNQAIHGDGLDTVLLSANANWICDRGIPMWNDRTRSFCEPYPPYRTISAMHLAGPAKRTSYEIRRTGGGSFEAKLLYGAGPADLRVAEAAD